MQHSIETPTPRPPNAQLAGALHLVALLAQHTDLPAVASWRIETDGTLSGLVNAPTADEILAGLTAWLTALDGDLRDVSGSSARRSWWVDAVEHGRRITFCGGIDLGSAVPA